MRKQPRDTNNPANPLYKSASLDITRANERIGKYRSCDVNVTLNFKKSNDMRGQTLDRKGAELTVNFTIAIKRATFEMKMIFDDLNDTAHLNVSKVAFVDSLTTDRSIKVADAGDSRRQTRSSAVGDASISISRTKADAKGSLGLRKKHSSASSRADKWSSATTYPMTGVAATYERNTINWSLDSLWTRQDLSEEQAYLSGEVFRNPTTNRQIRACRIRWDGTKASSSPEIHGSVRVMTQDLLISDVSFLNNEGKRLSWNAMRKLGADGNVASVTEQLAHDQEKIKERLVRQIIRKHLISQGMSLEGASLEICSARG
jgi:hypothetical protein